MLSVGSHQYSLPVAADSVPLIRSHSLPATSCPASKPGPPAFSAFLEVLKPSCLFARQPQKIHMSPPAPMSAGLPVDEPFRVPKENMMHYDAIVYRFDSRCTALFGAHKDVGQIWPQEVSRCVEELRACIVQPLSYKQLIGYLDHVHQQSGQDLYALRRLIFFAADGQIESWQAFTTSKYVDAVGFWPFIENPNNWLLERRMLQQRAMVSLFIRAAVVHDTITIDSQCDGAQLMIYAGPYGAGKSSRLRQQFFGVLADLPFGTLGSDVFKLLISHSFDGGVPFASLHTECSQLSYFVIKQWSAQVKGAWLLDIPLATPQDLTRLLDAHVNNTLIIDALHVPLHISLLRVLSRSIDGTDPRIPFRTLVQGWKRSAENYRAVWDVLKVHQNRCSYSLWVSDNTGHDSHVVLDINHEGTKALDVERLQQVLAPVSEASIAALAQCTVRELLADRTRVSAADADIMRANFSKYPVPVLDLPIEAAMDAYARLR